jgi:hypothetical protein
MIITWSLAYDNSIHMIDDDKKSPPLLAILMTKAICQRDACTLSNGWGPWLHWTALYATIGQVLAPHFPDRYHDHQFWHKTLCCGVVNLLSKASIQKAQNWPFTQLIKATSWVERQNALIGAEELSNFSSYQMLSTDKKWWRYQAAMKLVEKLMVMTLNSG